jgi:hypothetical protein
MDDTVGPTVSGRQSQAFEYRVHWAAVGGDAAEAKAFAWAPWVPNHASDTPRYPAKLFKPSFVDDLKKAVANRNGESPAVRSQDFYMRIWDAAYHSILIDKEMSENPSIQDYIQEHIQRSKWWDWNGENMSDEKGKTLAIAGGPSNIPSASTMKISRYCFQRGGPDDTTFEHAKAPPPPPSRVGENISFPSSSTASCS